MRPRLSSVARHARHPFLGKIYKHLTTHKRLVALVLFVIVVFLMFTETMITLIILGAMAIPATFITMYKRVVRLPPALELISLTTVMATIFYGPVTGIIYTIIVNFASEISSGHPDEMTLTYVPSRIVQVLFIHFAYSMGLTSVVALGIWSVVVFNAVQQPMFMALVDVEKRFKAVYFIILNIATNILIFKVFAPHLFALLQAIT